MRLNCNINGSQYSLVVNSDKPLSEILKEQIITFADNSQCQGASCGNCIVLINGNAALSCLLPAFKINGASILTFEGFQKTRFCHDIERAYAEIGNQPCPQCYASKTIIIESILNKARHTITAVLSDICPRSTAKCNIDIKISQDGSYTSSSLTSGLRGLTTAALINALSQALGHTIKKIPVTSDDILAIASKSTFPGDRVLSREGGEKEK